MHRETANGREVVWSPRTKPSGYFFVNGEKKYLNGSSLSIRSNQDLTGLSVEVERILQTIQYTDGRAPFDRKTETQASAFAKTMGASASNDTNTDDPSAVVTPACHIPEYNPTVVKARRVSSIVVSLDNGDEVARKSSQCVSDISQLCEGHVPRNSMLSNGTSTGITMVPDSGGIDKQWCYSSDEKEMSVLSHTPALEETVPSMIQDSSRSTANIQEQRDAQNVVGKERSLGCHEVEGESQMASSCGGVSQTSTFSSIAQHIVDCSSILDTDAGRSQMENIANHDGSLTVPCPPQHHHNEDTEITLSPTRNFPTEVRPMPASKTTRARLATTQESLLFPRPRNLKRKVYTANSKAEVDWDEDLRPSGDDGGAAVQDSLELTSVSSPTSTANEKINFSGKKKPQPRGSNGKKRSTNSQRKTNSTKRKRKSSPEALRTRGGRAKKSKHESVQKNNICHKDDAGCSEKAKPGASDIENADVPVPEDSKGQDPLNDGSISAAEDSELSQSPLTRIFQISEGDSTAVFDQVSSSDFENIPRPPSPCVNEVGSVTSDHAPIPRSESSITNISSLSQAHLSVQNMEQRGVGQGKSIGRKLAAALCNADLVSHDTLSKDVRNFTNHTLLHTVNQPESLRIDESAQRLQNPPVPPEALSQKDISGDSLGLIAVDKTCEEHQENSTRSIATRMATDITMHDLPDDFQSPIILGQPRQYPEDKLSDSIFEKKDANSHRRQKKVTSYDEFDNSLSKKTRAVSFIELDCPKEEQTTMTATPLQGFPSTNDDSLEHGLQTVSEAKCSWAIEKDRYFNSQKPSFNTSQHAANATAALSHPESPTPSTKPPRSHRKNTIVDANGSPRLASRMGKMSLRDSGCNIDDKIDDKTDGEELENAITSIEEDSDESEYDDSCSSIRSTNVAAAGNHVSFIQRLKACMKTGADLHFSPQNESVSRPQPIGMTTVNMETDFQQELPQRDSQAPSTPSAESRNPIGWTPAFVDSTTLIEKDDDDDDMEWQVSLQPPQKKAHDMLVNTSKVRRCGSHV